MTPGSVVNHVHPGVVDTDLANRLGYMAIDRGAEACMYATLLPANTKVRGEYIWHDCSLVDWVNGPLPQLMYLKHQGHRRVHMA